MPFSFDDQPIDLNCPECGRSVKTTVGAGRRSRSVRCPGGHVIQLKGSGLDQELKKVEKSMNDLTKRFR